MSKVVKALKAMGISSDAVAELKAPADLAMHTLNNTANQLATAIRESRGDIAAIEAEADITGEAKARRIKERREQLADRIAEIDADRARAAERLERWVGEARTTHLDTAAELLDEQQTRRAWERARHQIEQGTDALAVAQAAVEAGDRVTIEALRQELPAMGEPADVIAVLDDLETPLLSEPERELREIANTASKGDYWSRTAINYATAEVNGEQVHELPIARAEDGDSGVLRID
jgi:hypothetical protein